MLKLQTSISQKLKFSAKQQQSVKLLQYSTVELNQEILNILEQNPFLELESYSNELEQNETELAADDEYDYWNELGSKNENIMEEMYSPKESLHQHLKWQLDTRNFSDREYAIGLYILDSIENSGYFCQELEKFRKVIDISPKPRVRRILKVLKKIQRFDPPGVGARNLQECLLLQLQALSQHHPGRKLGIKILKNEYVMFCNQEFSKLKLKLKITEQELEFALDAIHRLNPSPGDVFNTGNSIYVIPDLAVKKAKGRWQVFIYNDLSEKIKLKKNKGELLTKVSTNAEKKFINAYYSAARWFKKGVKGRNKILLTVAQNIVDKQVDFMDQGDKFMHQLNLEKVAKLSNLHISTVSRAVNQKYIQTPHGLHELRYFFRKNLAGQQDISVHNIKPLIKQMITEEALSKPLSDEEIAKALLATQDINISRRTVAKYRQSMNIGSSSKRKLITF